MTPLRWRPLASLLVLLAACGSDPIHEVCDRTCTFAMQCGTTVRSYNECYDDCRPAAEDETAACLDAQIAALACRQTYDCDTVPDTCAAEVLAASQTCATIPTDSDADSDSDPADSDA